MRILLFLLLSLPAMAQDSTHSKALAEYVRPSTYSFDLQNTRDSLERAKGELRFFQTGQQKQQERTVGIIVLIAGIVLVMAVREAVRQ